MKLSYADIRKLQEQYGLTEMSSDAFARQQQQADPANDYSAGFGSGVGKLLKYGSFGLDQLINATELPQVTDAIGQVLGAPKGLFESVPRMTVDMIPMMLTGGAAGAAPALGMAGSSLLAGANTFEKTDSAGAGLVSAALQPLMPVAGRAGANLALNVGERFGLNTARSEALAVGNDSLSSSLGSFLARGPAAADAISAGGQALTQGGQLLGLPARATAFAGHEAGMFATMVASSAVQNAIIAPKGEGWSAFADTFTNPHELEMMALTQIPWTLLGARRQLRTPNDVKFVRDYASTIDKYTQGSARRAEVAGIAENVDSNLASRMLPYESDAVAFNKNLADDAKVANIARLNEIEYSRRMADLAKIDEERASFLKVGEDGSVVDTFPDLLPETNNPFLALEQTKFEEALVEAHKPFVLAGTESGLTAPALTGGDVVADFSFEKLPPSGRLALLQSTEPGIRLQAGAKEMGIPLETISEDATLLSKKGLNPDEAVREATEGVVESAKVKVRKKEKAQQTITTKKQERYAWFEERTKLPEAKAEVDLLNAKISGLGPKASPTAADSLISAYQKWVAGDAKHPPMMDGVEGLQKKLGGALKFANSEGKTNVGRIAHKGFNPDGTPIFGVGKAVGKNHKFATVEEARAFADKLNVSNADYNWTLEGTTVTGRPRKTTEVDPSVLAEMDTQRDEFVNAQRTAVRVEEKRALEEVKPKELKPLAEVVQELPQDVADAWADGDMTLAQRQFEAVAKFVKNKISGEYPKDDLPLQAIVAQEIGFTSKQDVRDYINDVAGFLTEYVSVKRLGPESAEPIRGTKTTLGNLLARAGLTDEIHINEAARLASLFEHQDLQFAFLNSKKEAGLFTVDRAGQQMVWLAADKSMGKNLFMFGLSHELNGHGFWEAFKGGKLDAETSHKVQRYSDLILSNTPEENSFMLNEIARMLPKEYRNDASLKKLWEQTTNDPDEVFANTNALISLVQNVGKPSAMRDFLRYMPKPIADVIIAMAKYARKLFESISGVQFLRKNGMLEGKFDPEKQAELHKYIDKMYDVFKVDTEIQAHAANALRLQALAEPGNFKDVLVGDGRKQFLQTSAGEHPDVAEVIKFLKLGDEKARLREGDWFDKFIGLTSTIGTKFPHLARIANINVERQQQYNINIANFLDTLGMQRRGVEVVAPKNNPVMQVMHDSRLSGAFDTIRRRENFMEKNAAQLIAEKDPEIMAALSPLGVGQKGIVLEAIKKWNEGHQIVTDSAHDLRYKGFVADMTKVLMMKDMTLTYVDAKAKAEQAVALARQGAPGTTGDAGVDYTISRGVKRLEDNYVYEKGRSWFVTEQRMEKYRARIIFKDKSRQSAYLDAKSPEEMLQKKQAYIDNPEVERIDDQTDVANAQVYAAKAYEDLISREQKVADGLIADLQAAGLAPELARQIAGQNNFGAMLRAELTMKQLPKNQKTRKFVEGRETQDTAAQQVLHTQYLLRALTKAIATKEFEAQKISPDIKGSEMMPTLEKSFHNFNSPDPESVRLISSLNYNMALSFNFFNMLQDASQPITSLLPSMLAAKGGGVVSSYKLVLSAMNTMGKHLAGKQKLTGNRLEVVEEFRKRNNQVGAYDTEYNNNLLEAMQARRVLEGKDASTLLDDFGKKPMFWVLNKGKSLHKHFTDFGASSTVLASYDFFIKQGNSHPEAKRLAYEMEKQANASAGRAGRAAGIWQGGDFSRTIAAAMTGLQTFSTNVIGSLKAHMQRGFFSADENSGQLQQNISNLLGKTGKVSASERANARKAFVSGLGSIIAMSGVLGIPGIAAMMLAMKELGWDAKKDLAESLATSDDPEDNVTQQIIMHGMANLLGGDVASRMQVQGTLGINGYNGFDIKQVFGPTAGIISNMGSGLQNLVGGNFGQALEDVAPNFIKRPLKLFRDDWEFRDSKGTLLLGDASSSEKGLYALLGVKPTRLSQIEELRNMQRSTQEIAAKEKSSWVQDKVGLLQDGDVNTVRLAIEDRVKEEATSLKDANAIREALNDVIAKTLVEQAIPWNPRASNANINGILPGGNQAPGELQRLQMTEQIRLMLGSKRRTSQREVQKASALDSMMLNNPYVDRRRLLQMM